MSQESQVKEAVFGAERPEEGAHAQRPPGVARQIPYRFDPRSKSPALACFLSLMPGLGQVYVGYYQRGFVHAIVVGSLIAILAQQEGGGPEPPLLPLFGMFLAFFWLYNVIDAGRRAALYNQALQGEGPVPLPDDLSVAGLRGSVAGGAILIVAGVVLLAHTRFGVSLEWLEAWWPLAPILFGAYLVAKGVQGKASVPEKR